MEATYDSDGDRVVVRNDARQQLYDASGYGEPLDGDSVALTPVEAAYLLGEGKIEDLDGDGYASFVRHAVEDEAVLRVYADLRDRGYYLSHDEELYLYARGDHPANSSPETRVEAVDEDAVVGVGALPSLLAVADDDGDVTYFAVGHEEPDGGFPSLNDVSVETEHVDAGRRSSPEATPCATRVTARWKVTAARSYSRPSRRRTSRTAAFLMLRTWT
ncbi:MAG: hypothetical protein U5J64_05475 [Halobacteriales archaeon]|nr:hypothetical protein [Halobacteriales archaeon]